MISHLLVDFDRTLNDSDHVYETNLDGFLSLTGQQVLDHWQAIHREVLSKEPRERHEDVDLHIKLMIDRAQAGDRQALQADLNRRIRRAQQECWNATALFDDAIPFLHRAKDAGFLLHLATGDFAQQKADAIEHQAGRSFFARAFDESVLGLGKGKRDYFDRLLGRLGIAPGNALVIGDSLTADIGPAREAGIATVWLRRRNEKLSDRIIADITLANLVECTAHLRALITLPPARS